jgi:hypothetical protein
MAKKNYPKLDDEDIFFNLLADSVKEWKMKDY